MEAHDEHVCDSFKGRSPKNVARLRGPFGAVQSLCAADHGFRPSGCASTRCIRGCTRAPLRGESATRHEAWRVQLIRLIGPRGAIVLDHAPRRRRRALSTAANYPRIMRLFLARIAALVLNVGHIAPAAAASDHRALVVVHAPDLAEVARQWADYRRSGGWEAVCIDAAALDAPHAAAGVTAEAIRAELRRRFRAARLRGAGPADFAVLLLGPAAHADGRPAIPMWHRPQRDPDLIGREGLADIATDLDYQLADDLDDLPDFALGRVPARSVAEALAALDKVKRYETAAPSGPWRRRITYLAGEGGFGPIDTLLERLFVRLVDQVVPYEFDVGMTYANPRSPYCAPPTRLGEIVLERLSEGALLVNYVGHGQVNMLDRLTLGDQRYDVCSIESLRRLRGSGNRLPIALLVACWTGRIDLPADRRGLGEMMLFHPHAPVAVIASGRITHPYANALLQKNLTQQLCVQRPATVGAAHIEALRALASPDEIDRQLESLAQPIALAMKWKSTPADLRLMHISMYGLLGDPALRIAWPPGEIVDWKCDAPAGRVSGAVAGAARGEAIITIETMREPIHRAAELRTTIGASNAALDAALTHNYAIANDKVLWRATVALDASGRFTAALPRDVLAHPHAAWVKAYVSAMDAAGAVMDAARAERIIEK